MHKPPQDTLGRGLDDLRISVIDRCNFRCNFCMPAGRTYEFLPRKELLTFEELARVAGAFARLGVRKIRLTGGEPLLRSQLEELIRQIAAVDGIEDIALTTNGSLLADRAEILREAGLNRVTVSVESLDAERFAEINGVGHSLENVLHGIDVARSVGFERIKVNTVVMKDSAENEVAEIAAYFKERGVVVRFIEFMDVGTLNEWSNDRVVSAAGIVERIHRFSPIESVPRERPSDVAQSYRYLDDGLEVGVISSITAPFCGDCTRARLSAEGQLYTCLFASRGYDLKALLRGGASDAELAEVVSERWSRRADRYSELRAERLRQGPLDPPRVEMYRIGG